MVSGSQDCTVKMWKIGRSLTEGKSNVRKVDIPNLKVKYTQLAHDKVTSKHTHSTGKCVHM